MQRNPHLIAPSNFGFKALFATLFVVGVPASTEEIHSEMRIDMRSGGCGPACPAPRKPRPNRETQPTPGH